MKYQCLCYADNCPLRCVHTLVEHADTWFLGRIVIPWTTNGDAIRVDEILRNRNEMWTFQPCGVTRSSVTSSVKLFNRLATSRVFTMIAFERWLQQDMICNSNHPFQDAQALFVDGSIGRLFVKKTFIWITLLTSSDVAVYFDDREQIGILSKRNFKCQQEIDCGRSSNTFIGLRSHAIEDVGVRWSTLENSYFGGGPSLINHACSLHANVMIDYSSGIVVSLNAIKCEEVLRADYGEDPNLLSLTRHVQCNMCF